MVEQCKLGQYNPQIESIKIIFEITILLTDKTGKISNITRNIELPLNLREFRILVDTIFLGSSYGIF